MAEQSLARISRENAIASGCNRYFTGKPCKHGHVAERYVRDRTCTICTYQNGIKSRRNNQDAIREYQKDYGKKYRRENKERYRLLASKWRKENREQYLKSIRKYKSNNKDKTRISDTIYRRKRYNSDPVFKCSILLRQYHRRALLALETGLDESLFHRLGYSPEELKQHIERQFIKGMSWNNQGEWHIDHITPIKWFVDNGITDPAKINCLSNLRPVWARLNLRKGATQTHLL